MSHYTTRKKIDVMIKLIAGGSAIGASLVAPNAVELFMKMADPVIEKDFDKKELEKLLKYMEKTKLIELQVRDQNITATLTKKARKRLNQTEIDEIETTEPKVWDRKWRIVMYDIPVDHPEKSARLYMVEQLHRLRFYMAQRSIWFFPYPCSEQIMEIARRLEIDQYITLIVGDIEAPLEDKLIKHFRLHQKT